MTIEVKEARDVLQEQIDKYGQEYDAKGIAALNMAIKALEIELLTDTEQRIFLSAMNRERKVCRMIDEIGYIDDSKIKLVWVCNSIERKVKKIWE